MAADMTSGIHHMGVTGLLTAYRAGRVSVAAAVDHFLDRIARLDGRIGAFTHVDAEGARRQALESARRWDRARPRALEGVPVAVKANIDVMGMPVHGGMAHGGKTGTPERRAERDSVAVARLREAGAIILGLTAMDEAALGATTDNPHHGLCHNPHRHGYTPGGSSGGAAAAVASGFAAGALGSDTLGSVRIPASYCGIAGLKPGQGVVSAQGLMPLVPRLETIGTLAISARDCGLLLDAIAENPPAPSTGLPTRFAVLDSMSQVPMEPAVLAAFRLAADLLKGLGLDMREHASPIDHRRVRIAAYAEAAMAADALHGGRDDLGPVLRGAIGFARSVSPDLRAQGRAAMDAAGNELEAIVALDDAILLPTTPQPAFPHTGPHTGEPPSTQADFTLLANLAGLPAISIPAGWTADGLPVGVQLVGRRGGEAALVALATRLEATLNAWRPPVVEEA